MLGLLALERDAECIREVPRGRSLHGDDGTEQRLDGFTCTRAKFRREKHVGRAERGNKLAGAERKCEAEVRVEP